MSNELWKHFIGFLLDKYGKDIVLETPVCLFTDDFICERIDLNDKKDRELYIKESVSVIKFVNEDTKGCRELIGVDDTDNKYRYIQFLNIYGKSIKTKWVSNQAMNRLLDEMDKLNF